MMERGMQKTLFPHQLLAIEKMEEREIRKKILHPTYSIELNMSIYADIAGFGKTVAMIGLILNDRMEWDLGEEHTQSFISGVYGNGCIVKRSLLTLKRINTNLIVAGTAIIRQWVDEMAETTLRYAVISSRKTLEQMDPSEYEVILCTPSFYNYLMERFPSYAWKRFIYDEPTHTKIPSMRQVIAGFLWFLTATPEILLQQHRYSHNFLSSIFTQYMDYNLYKNLIIKNEDEFVRQSFLLPPMHQHHYSCFQPVFHVVKDLLSDSILEMIAAGNIEGAVRCLGGNASSNLFALIEKDKLDSIEQAEWKLARFSRVGDQGKMEKWRMRIDRLREELSTLRERIEQMIEQHPCSICLEKKDKPILLTCCQNMFCGRCVLKWLQKSSNCPLCRRKITTDHLIYISSPSPLIMPAESELSSPSSMMMDAPVLQSKIETILMILQRTTTGKTIIFSSFQETFDLIRETLRENEIVFGEMRGGMAQKERTLREFKSGGLNVLFLHSMESGAGLNLQEATDLILYHNMTEAMMIQIRGRAYRVGRTLPLHVHLLQ